MLLYLLGNVVTQYVCISSVFVLTTECASLTVTLVVTLRKFLSLIFSIVYFKNPFTVFHWLGTGLVFGGTLMFSDIPGMIRASREQKEKKICNYNMYLLPALLQTNSSFQLSKKKPRKSIS